MTIIVLAYQRKKGQWAVYYTSPQKLWGLLWILIGWFIKLSFQTFKLLILIYRRGSFVYHWGCTFMSYSLMHSKILIPKSKFYKILRELKKMTHYLLILYGRPFYFWIHSSTWTYQTFFFTKIKDFCIKCVAFLHISNKTHAWTELRIRCMKRAETFFR